MKQLNAVVNELMELEPVKTWSLIVTLLGDLDGTELTGKQLRVFMDALGIKPEATRVALHRLKRDGWIASKKTGREVTYFLSDRARNDTDAVYDDVYGKDAKYPEGWQILVVSETIDCPASTPSIRIGRHLVVTPRPAESIEQSSMEVQFVQNTIPTWLQHKLLPPETIAVAEKLVTSATDYLKHCHGTASIEAQLLRLLLLHHWRKIALRIGCWAHIGLMQDGLIYNCQKAMTGFLYQTEKLCVIE